MRRVVASALLGTLTTCGVAALCAWSVTAPAGSVASRWGARNTGPDGSTVGQPLNGKLPPHSRVFRFQAYDGGGVTFAISDVYPFSNFTPAAPPPPAPPAPEDRTRPWERRWATPWVDGWRPWPPNGTKDASWVKASGWPFRAFATNLRSTNAPNFANHAWTAESGWIVGANVFPGWADWPPMYPRVIPLYPIWEGLAADTAVFAAAWWLLLGGIGASRRWWRSNRGVCIACGYSREGLDNAAPCPECGRRLELGGS